MNDQKLTMMSVDELWNSARKNPGDTLSKIGR